jgi:hypothetical protein
VSPDPSTEQLVAFADSLLANLAPTLRERAVLEQAVEHHRELWLTLYEASSNFAAAADAQ